LKEVTKKLEEGKESLTRKSQEVSLVEDDREKVEEEVGTERLTEMRGQVECRKGWMR
jgi:hypothetical protein